MKLAACRNAHHVETVSAVEAATPATRQREQACRRAVSRAVRWLAAACTAAAVLLTAPTAGATPSWDYVVSLTSDYDVSGRVSVLDVMPPWSIDDPVASVHSDADARFYNGLVYVVNHLYGDNIQVLDPSQGFATIRQFSVGPGTNPQDIAFASPTRAYVTRHESAFLLEVDPTTGAVTDSVDLSAFADSDGLPEVSGMAVEGDLLFIAVQRLDRDNYWLPVPPSYLAVLDTSTNELVDADPSTPGVQGVVLPLLNPYRELHVDGDGLIYVACSGNWGVSDGGIVEVDPVALEATAVVATEAQLGGELYDFTLPIGDRAHAVVSTSSPSWQQFCIAFDWSTGAKVANVWKPGGYSVMDIELHEGTAQLFLADRTYAAPGVRVFDALDGTQLTTGPIGASLPPHDLLVVGESVASVEPVEGGTSLALSVWPNPSPAGSAVAFSLPRPAHVRAVVYDVGGREVRVLADESFPGGEVTIDWDGRDEAGNAVAAGVYLMRIEAGHCSGTTKLAVLR